MNLLAPVQSIMTSDLVTLSPSASMAEAATLFSKYRIHHIPIVQAGELVGILSKTDYYKFHCPHADTAAEKEKNSARMEGTRVDSLMTKGIAKLEPTTRINVALEVFKENIFHAIPIVDGTKLVGIVTTLDIIKHLDQDKSAEATY